MCILRVSYKTLGLHCCSGWFGQLSSRCPGCYTIHWSGSLHHGRLHAVHCRRDRRTESHNCTRERNQSRLRHSYHGSMGHHSKFGHRSWKTMPRWSRNRSLWWVCIHVRTGSASNTVHNELLIVIFCRITIADEVGRQCPFSWRIPRFNTWFLEPTRVHNANGMSNSLPKTVTWQRCGYRYCSAL